MDWEIYIYYSSVWLNIAGADKDGGRQSGESLIDLPKWQVMVPESDGEEYCRTMGIRQLNVGTTGHVPEASTVTQAETAGSAEGGCMILMTMCKCINFLIGTQAPD